MFARKAIRNLPQSGSAPALMAGRLLGEAAAKVTADGKETVMKKWFAYGGIAASVILVAFGIGAIVIGVNGFNDVRDEIAAQQIVAGDDAAELTNGKLQPGQEITTGAEARAFADIMEHHTLDSTKGKRYAEMGRFLTADGSDTSDEALAAKTPDGPPGRERPAQHVGDRDGAHDRAQHGLLRRAGRGLLDRDGRRAPAHRHRLPRPHARRRARDASRSRTGRSRLDTASAAT